MEAFHRVVGLTGCERKEVSAGGWGGGGVECESLAPFKGELNTPAFEA